MAAAVVRLLLLGWRVKKIADLFGPPDEPAPTSPSGSVQISGLVELERDIAALQDGFPRAYARALNKTTAGVKTDLVSLVRGEYNYRAAGLRDRIRVESAIPTRLTAMVVSSGRQPHLTDIIDTRQIIAGVSVNVKKSTGRQVIPRAFIALGKKSNKEIVFRRAVIDERMVGRMPIVPRQPPHPEHIYNTPPNWAKIQEQAKTRLDTNLAHEMDVVLRGIA